MTTQTNVAVSRRHPILRTLGIILAAFVFLIVLLIIFWRWDWFVPTINRRMTAALHRPATISHLHVHLGFVTTVTVDDLDIKQPEGFEKEKEDFASAKHITVSANVWRYITGHGIALPLIAVDTPRGDIVSRLDGQNNYSFSSDKDKSSSSSSGDLSSLPKIGEVRINDGDVRLALAKMNTDMRVLMHTTPPKGDDEGSIVIDLKGRYAQAPINGHIVGGSLLTLTNETRPYPIDGRLANGPTYVTLRGVVNDPLHFKGTNLDLHFAGPDMALLYALTAIPIPHTPAYNVTGKLNYTAARIRFDNFEGRMGSSDIGGNIAVDPRAKPINVDARLHSHRVDLADLGGFIGAKPDKDESKANTASNQILPDQKINVPKLNAVNAHLTYHGDHIENKKMPLDNIDTDIVIQDGAIDVKHLNFAVGNGTLAMAATLNPAKNEEFATKLRVDVSRLSIQRLMQSTGTFKGEGTLGGHITLTSTGNSVANLVANGDGGITLVVDHGGDVSALLPDLMGLKVGSAILSALGIPQRSDLQCFIADMPLRQGIIRTNSMLLQTSNTRTIGGGIINMRNDTLDYHVDTRSTGLNVLSFPGRVNISGPIKSPTIMPGAEIIGRAAATAALAVVFPPAVLLPTIQFGVGKGSVCEQALAEVNTRPASGIKPGATTGKGAPQVRAAPTPAATHHGKAKKGHVTNTSDAAKVHQAWERKFNKEH
ncbi:AsmA family protein [Kozakia baliensis]|uniref:AsmA family protein n=1 Tax=Kozakia baliensis TaxID=153496 RepID=UPI00049510D6|nr:AsmA family protein [Kozakia baliensis]